MQSVQYSLGEGPIAAIGQLMCKADVSRLPDFQCKALSGAMSGIEATQLARSQYDFTKCGRISIFPFLAAKALVSRQAG